MRDLLRQLGETLPVSAPLPPRLIWLSDDRPVIFVGDIHGDRDAVETVFSRFPSSDHCIVFLGDIVDRGPDSLGALTAIAKAKCKEPSSVHILMGNHEARSVSQFSPADFWEGLPQHQSEELAQLLAKLPLAAWHPSGILAVHGGLPDCPSLEAIDAIELGSEAWRAVTWGDWGASDHVKGIFAGRPTFGPSTFERRSLQLGIKVLIRSHQPSAPLYLFEDRCLTLFTSIAYGDGTRQVVRLLPDQQIETARDLELIEL